MEMENRTVSRNTLTFLYKAMFVAYCLLALIEVMRYISGGDKYRFLLCSNEFVIDALHVKKLSVCTKLCKLTVIKNDQFVRISRSEAPLHLAPESDHPWLHNACLYDRFLCRSLSLRSRLR